MKISFTFNGFTTSLEATDYGVDIFFNGKYSRTLNSEQIQTPNYWIGKGIEEVLECIYICERNLGK